MAKFDLTSRMGQYLDRHLVFPLLEFLSAKEIYDEQELLKAKLDILSKTNMVDYAIDIRKQLYPKEDVPEELKERRVHVVTQLQELQHEVEPILQLMGDDEVMKNMENMRDSKTLINFLYDEVMKNMENMRDSKTLINFLSKEYAFEIQMIESLHKLAKYRYECGNYSVSTSYLYFCMLVLPPNDKNFLSVLWGK
ncbi:eIF3 subunit 6 N terminal domain [Popillia japonica]|uniref:EIF3 subunit 6 N terminal domain n=1 Tax=Popillia japonica TaxID=7064 RepID=A0AAW1JU15_POPJA